MEKKGDGSTVTLQALRDVFNTPAWADLKKEASESRITKLISSSVFKSSSGDIDVNTLILFGVLNCPADARHKSQALYPCLQEGGPTKQQFISAGDKDIKQIIQKMMYLTTVDLAKLMAEVDQSTAMDLEDRQEEIDYALEDTIELNYLNPLYGNISKMSYEEWINASEKAENINLVWYDPQAVRMLTLHRAGITANDGVGADKADFDAFTELCTLHKINLTNEEVE